MEKQFEEELKRNPSASGQFLSLNSCFFLCCLLIFILNQLSEWAPSSVEQEEQEQEEECEEQEEEEEEDEDEDVGWMKGKMVDGKSEKKHVQAGSSRKPEREDKAAEGEKEADFEF